MSKSRSRRTRTPNANASETAMDTIHPSCETALLQAVGITLHVVSQAIQKGSQGLIVPTIKNTPRRARKERGGFDMER